MMEFQIQDDNKLILEKNLIRKSNMFILGIDDHGLSNIYKLSFKTMFVGEKHLLCVNDKEYFFWVKKRGLGFHHY